MSGPEKLATGWIIYTAFVVGWLVFLVLDHSRPFLIACDTFNVALGVGMAAFWMTRRN